jgi:hypothetical protein
MSSKKKSKLPKILYRDDGAEFHLNEETQKYVYRDSCNYHKIEYAYDRLIGEGSDVFSETPPNKRNIPYHFANIIDNVEIYSNSGYQIADVLVLLLLNIREKKLDINNLTNNQIVKLINETLN